MPSNTTTSIRPQANSFSRLFEIALLVVVMGIYLFAALSEGHNFAGQWFIRDDAFYYFKVAQNITEGRGVTFDGINPTNGYHPLWMLVCIPIFSLARFNLILPLRVLVLVTGGISAWMGILLFRLVKRTLSAPAAILAASYWVFDRAIHYNVTMFGLETGLTALTMTAFLLAMANLNTSSLRGGSSSEAYRDPTKQSPPGWGLLRSVSVRRTNTAYSTIARNDGTNVLTLGLLAVAMTFSRLDTIFLALLAGVWILLRGTAIRTRLMLDVGIIVSAAFVSMAWRTGLPEYFAYTQSAVIFAALGLVVQIPIFYFLGLYDAPNLHIKNYVLRFITASLLGSGIIFLVMIGLLASDQLSGLPRSALPVYAGLVFAGAGIVRLAARTAAKRPEKIQLKWKNIFREGIQYYGILGSALAAYMLFNKILFGTFMPVSGQIKAWWGSLQGSTYGNPISTFSGFLGLEREEGLNAWGPIVYLLHNLKDWMGINLWLALGLMAAFIFLILLTRPQRAARAAVSMGLPLLLTGSLAQLFYYNGQGYAGAKDWYWVSQMLMFALLGALLFDLVTRPLRRFRFSSSRDSQAQKILNANEANKRIEKRNFAKFAHSRNSRFKFLGIETITGEGLVWSLTALLVLAYLIPFATVIVQRMPWGAERTDQPYLDVLPFLESNTEEGALIGMTGGGNIGYFIEGRTIVNMDGLINSYEYFLALRAGRGDEYLASIGLDYIFSNPDILQNPPYNGQFDEWSEKVAEFGKKDLLKYRH